MFNIDQTLFLIELGFFLLWFRVAYLNGVKSLYSLYYFLNVTIFLGPILYYKIGFIAYNTVVSDQSLEDYMYIGTAVAAINIFFKKIVDLKERNIFSYVLNSFSKKAGGNKMITSYYALVLLICLFYIILYLKYLPLYGLIINGEIGERLDLTGAVPFYITASSVFMICIPSAFFYFKEYQSNKLLNFVLFMFVLVGLTAGGNKGIVSFFILFYILFSFKNIAKWKVILASFSVLFIYAVSKGIKTLNAESLAYLSESPFRRLFATQGVGFIGRIKMVYENKFDLNSIYNIKQQLYAEMYNMPLGSGSGPTHFMGDLYVSYGIYIMALIYVIYLLFALNLIKAVDTQLDYKKHSLVLWNVFILIYLSTMSDISVANVLRLSIVFLNLLIVFQFSKFKVS